MLRLPKAFRAASLITLPALMLIITGCGASKGDLSGMVTLKSGGPLKGGSINIQSAKGDTVGGSIGQDGKFEVLAIPAGPCKISIASDNSAEVEYFKALSAGVRGGKNAPPPKPPKPTINPKYNDFTLSGLSTTINSGKNTYNVTLEE